MPLHPHLLPNAAAGPVSQACAGRSSGAESQRWLHDAPSALPPARGRTSRALLDLFDRDPRHRLSGPEAACLAWHRPSADEVQRCGGR